MENPRLAFPEVVGKSVAELSVYDDATCGREVLVRFTDGTQLSVCVGVKQSILEEAWRTGPACPRQRHCNGRPVGSGRR